MTEATMTDEQKTKAKEESKKILAKYKVNEKVVEGYLKHDWAECCFLDPTYLENEIKEWLMHCRKPLSDYAEASTFFMALTTD